MGTINIDGYTDQYIYKEILGFPPGVTPSDRELEAKLLAEIYKTENSDDPNASNLANMYNDIYDRFFSDEEGKDQMLSYDPPDNADQAYITNTPTADPAVSFTTILIDSQYRNPNLYSVSTNFTFDLSTTVRNVKEIYLDSITVPITWYNINSEQTEFYIVPTNGYGDIYTVKIDPGYYTNSALIMAINRSFETLSQTYTDVSFGNTNISLDDTNHSILNLDITRHYGENTYKMTYFPRITRDAQGNPTSSTPSVFDFMGYTQNAYSFSTAVSDTTTLPPLSSTGSYSLPLFLLTENNNYFQIVQYVPSPPDDLQLNDPSSDPFNYLSDATYDEATKTFSSTPEITIIETYTYVLDLSTNIAYSRNALQTEINRLMSNSNTLTSSIFALATNPTGITINPFYLFDIHLNSSNTSNAENSKIAMYFPHDVEDLNADIWLGPNSAFSFDASINELNVVIGNEPYVPLTNTTYIISTNAQIEFACTNPDYPNNNYVVTVPDGTYDLEDYINAINTGIYNANEASKNSENLNGILYGTNAYLNTSDVFSMDIRLQKIFTQENFYYILGDFWTNENTALYTDVSYQTYFFDIPVVSDASYIVAQDSNICFTITPKVDSNINITPINVLLPVGGISNNQALAFAITTALNAPPVSGWCIYDSINSVLKTNIYLNYALTTDDYTATFTDPNNTWFSYLNVTQDQAYTLSATYPQYYTLTANSPISIHTIQVTENNQTIVYKPNSNLTEDTLYLTIPDGDYNIDTLLNVINTEMQSAMTTNNDTILAGSKYIKVTENNRFYIKFYANINQNYTATDYSIVFFKIEDTCTEVQRKNYNASLNTLGASLGYSQILYDLTNNTPTENNTVSLMSENEIDINSDQYLLLVIDDFIHASVNGSIVTGIAQEVLLPLPDYVRKSDRTRNSIYADVTSNDEEKQQCYQVVSGIRTNGEIMTARQYFSSQTILDGYINSIKTIANSAESTYSNQLNQSNIQNVLAVIPIFNNISSNGGNNYVCYSSSSQNRIYYGPVNLSRMSVKLLDSKGNIVNLNGNNWSFILTCKIVQ